jgi:hypothetical protein
MLRKSLLTLFILLPVAVQAQNWNAWQQEKVDGESFRWRTGYQNVDTTEKFWIPTRPGVPGHEGSTITTYMQTYSYAQIENIYSDKALMLTAILFDPNGQIVFKNRIGIAPGRGTTQSQEIDGNPGNYRWALQVEWQTYHYVAPPKVRY